MQVLVDDEGEAAVATVLLLPALLFGLFMAIQVLIGYYVRSVASAAATDAASFYAQDGVDADQVRHYARTFVLDNSGGFVSPGDLQVTVSTSGDSRVVRIDGDTNLFWGIGLGVQASAPIERFNPQES